MVKYKISKKIREKFDWTITRKRKRTGLENSKKKQKTGIFMETKLMEQKINQTRPNRWETIKLKQCQTYPTRVSLPGIDNAKPPTPFYGEMHKTFRGGSENVFGKTETTRDMQKPDLFDGNDQTNPRSNHYQGNTAYICNRRTRQGETLVKGIAPLVHAYLHGINDQLDAREADQCHVQSYTMYEFRLKQVKTLEQFMEKDQDRIEIEIQRLKANFEEEISEQQMERDRIMRMRTLENMYVSAESRPTMTADFSPQGVQETVQPTLTSEAAQWPRRTERRTMSATPMISPPMLLSGAESTLHPRTKPNSLLRIAHISPPSSTPSMMKP